jgi:hypothetical protein
MPMLVPIIFCIFFHILSVLSPFRSRIYFTVAPFATVFWCFGYRRRLFAGIVIAFCLVIPMLTIIPKQMVRVVARRVLSTILAYDRNDVSALQDRWISASGEMGWSSNFRSSILEAAMRNIRMNPLLVTR